VFVLKRYQEVSAQLRDQVAWVPSRDRVVSAQLRDRAA
jgi:hypothetical protein